MCSSIWCSTFCREPSRLHRTSGRGSPRPRHSRLRDLPSFTVTGPGGITDTVGAPGEGGGHQCGDEDTTTKDVSMATGTVSPWGHLEHGEDISMGMGDGDRDSTTLGASGAHDGNEDGDTTIPGASGAHRGHQHGDGDITTPGAPGGHQYGDMGTTTPGAPEAWIGHGDGDMITPGYLEHMEDTSMGTGTPPPWGHLEHTEDMGTGIPPP